MGQIGRLIGDPVEPQARDAYVWYAHPCAQTYPSTEINCGYSRQSKVTSMKKPNGIGDQDTIVWPPTHQAYSCSLILDGNLLEVALGIPGDMAWTCLDYVWNNFSVK